eukprot:31302-Pelagococcus_subviridis.AAC.11
MREPAPDALLEELHGVVAARHADDRGADVRLLQEVHDAVQQRLLRRRASEREEVELLEDENHRAAAAFERSQDFAHERDVLREPGGAVELELLPGVAQLARDLAHADFLVRV